MLLCYVMRGIPGVGKSTWILDHVPGAHVVSADFYHTASDGTYQYQRERAGIAHDTCFRDFMMIANRGSSPLVVDNTNTRLWELAPYYRVAEACGYKVEIVWLLCDPELAIDRGIHGVPPEQVRTMARTFDPLPAHWNVKIVTVPTPPVLSDQTIRNLHLPDRGENRAVQ